MGAGAASVGDSGQGQQQQEWSPRRQLPDVMTFMLLQWLPHVTHTFFAPWPASGVPGGAAAPTSGPSGERPTSPSRWWGGGVV